MKAIKIELTDEQKRKLSKIEKGIKKIESGSELYAIFAQIHYPDGKIAVTLVKGQDVVTIHNILRSTIK